MPSIGNAYGYFTKPIILLKKLPVHSVESLHGSAPVSYGRANDLHDYGRNPSMDHHEFNEEDMRHALHRYGPPQFDPQGRFDRERWETVTKIRVQPTPSRRLDAWKFAAGAVVIGGMFTASGLLRLPAPTTAAHRPVLEVVKWVNGQTASYRSTAPQDHARLQKIAHALATAKFIRDMGTKRMTSPVLGPLPMTPIAADGVPILYLAYNTGEVVSIMPDNRIAVDKNTLSIHWRHHNRVVIARHHGYRVVRSPYLARLLRTTSLWTPANPMSISATGTHVVIRGQGLVTNNHVVLTVSPLLKGIGGGESGEPADFVLATVPVKNGSYHWSGTVHIPQGWTVYHAVTGWAIAIDAKAPSKWPSLGSYNMSQMLPLSLSVTPVTTIRTASQALGALQEWAYAAPPPWTDIYPLWPTSPGQQTVTWMDWADHRWHGDQITRVIPISGGYRVTITCIATTPREKRAWSTTWFVHRNALVTGLTNSGAPPHTGVKRLLRPKR